MESLTRAYRGRRVFVTGHTGFKGTWLSTLLHDLGAEVCGFALAPNTSPNHFDVLGLTNAMHSVIGNVDDLDHLRGTMAEFAPEIVFHLAAQPLVRQSYHDPVETFRSNVLGATHLLEAVRQTDSIRSLVFITSDKAYENVEWVWGYRETDRLGGQDPYSASKGAAEIVYSSYERSFFAHRPDLACAVARAGNVIGGGDWSADRIIPDCVRAIEAGEPIRLRNPNATRPWQHVLEPLSGYVLLGERLLNAPGQGKGAWNFGPSTHEVRTVKDVADAIIAHLGSGQVKIEQTEGQPHEAQLLQLNCDKAHQFLNWRPRWGVDKTLEATARWYAEFIKGADMQAVTRAQIAEYFEGSA
ncbi:CDP-glucose 4,6-dehydratase [Pontivivens insulae]|nr:CDP-glucose 4,6-dehydratase [Pontivivens insulae]